MKRAMRILTVSMCVMMIFSLAACGGTQSGTETEADKTAVAENSSGTAQGTAEAGKTYDENMTISWASVMVKEGTDYNADEFTKQWCEKFNIKWDMIPLTWDNWAEKLRIWINSEDMPDIATWDYKHGEFATYVEQELVKKLPDDWKARWPNVSKAYDATVIGAQLDKMFGGTYCLPKPRFAMNKPSEILPDHMSLYMRKDWMEAAGAEIKDAYTIDELLQIARLIKEKDPGKLGNKLVPIEVRTGNMALLFTYASYAYNRSPADFYRGEDGKYKWGPADPQTLEGLKLYQNAYREGLLHKEFYTLKQNEDLEDYYVAGTAAITCEGGLGYYQNLYGKELQRNLGLDPNKAMHIATILGNDGKYYSPEVINFWTANIFSPSIEDKKLERIMDIFDYSASEDGQLSLRLGIKDKDWEKDANGDIISKLPAGESVDTVYDSIMPLYINMLILSDDFDMINPSYDQSYRDRTKRLYALRTANSDASTLVPTDWTAYFQDSPSRRKVAFDYANEYAQLILKDGDLEANWKAWVKDRMQLVEPVLKELDAAAK
jgi:putative aldouronate transport system substrate-binding protein